MPALAALLAEKIELCQGRLYFLYRLLQVFTDFLVGAGRTDVFNVPGKVEAYYTRTLEVLEVLKRIELEAAFTSCCGIEKVQYDFTGTVVLEEGTHIGILLDKSIGCPPGKIYRLVAVRIHRIELNLDQFEPVRGAFT